MHGRTVVSVAPERARLDSLTGARFIAAFGVFLFHSRVLGFQPMFDGTGAFGQLLMVIGRHGAAGVDFFFILSGFVLAWSWRPDDSPGAFFRRRFARIAPAYWVAFLYGLLWAISTSTEPLAQAKRAVPALFGLQAWFPRTDISFAADGVEWSVSAEMFFYALFPLLILWALRRGRWALAVPAAVLTFVLPETLGRMFSGEFITWLINVCPAMRIGEFICGLLIAVVMREGVRCRVDYRAAALVYFLGYFLLPLAPSWVPARALSVAAMALLIAALAQRDIDGGSTWLARHIPVKLGIWSYCFYLVHQVTLSIDAAVLRRLIHGPALGPTWLIVSLLTTAGLAALLHTLVERPAERRLRGPRPMRAVRAVPVASP